MGRKRETLQVKKQRLRQGVPFGHGTLVVEACCLVGLEDGKAWIVMLVTCRNKGTERREPEGRLGVEEIRRICAVCRERG